MREKGRHYRQHESSRYMLRFIKRIAIGSIIILWGSLLVLKQVGLISKEVSTWPFVFVAFGTLLIASGIYRLFTREKPAFS